MFKVAICDDDKLICSEIEKIIHDYNKNIEIDIFYSGERLYNFLKDKNYYNLIFLDIEMEILNGVNVGKKIREELGNQTLQIVYISSKESYAMELFKVRTLDFLIKPIKKSDIIRNVDYTMDFVKKVKKVFEYSTDGVKNKLPLSEILYFESIGRKIKIATLGECLFTYGRLYEINEEIAQEDFIMVHRSFLINFSHVSKYTYEQIEMINGDIIPVSQQNRKAVRVYFFNSRRK